MMEEIKQEELTQEQTLEQKLQESNDKYLRLYAEYDNYRKRVQKEKEDLILHTKSKMLSSVLDIDNDISIAAKSIKNENDKEGILLILLKLETFLKSQGVEVIQTDKYDTDLHEVISVLDIGEDKVIDVVTKGYSINGKPVRFPKIILGK